MKFINLIAILISTGKAFAVIPDVVLDYKNSYNGYGTFAGHLSEKPSVSLGLTVNNGGIKFSTITDKDGNWAISFRQRVITSDITVWSLSNSDSSTPMRFKLE